MTDNREEITFIKVEANSFQELCDRLAELENENKFLKKQNNALKMRCSKYCLEISDLETEINDLKFTQKFLNSEEAGRRFAEELLGGASQ